MISALVATLLDLGDRTSTNLGFVRDTAIHLNYGEETITETNLLELCRSHPHEMRLRTFNKREEALNGSDWEWHIVGRKLTFGMRIQAKRVQNDGRLKIPYAVGNAGIQQITLLQREAKRFGLMPIYCLYGSEDQRQKWKKQPQNGDYVGFEYGCLLAHARHVARILPTSLQKIEAHSYPWHYLVSRYHYSRRQRVAITTAEDALSFMASHLDVSPQRLEPDPDTVWDIPTMHELNSGEAPDGLREGVSRTRADFTLDSIADERYIERHVRRLLITDVRGGPPYLDDLTLLAR